MDNQVILIIILNWNGWADTKECLDSVLKLNDVKFITLVVDNGSENDCDLIEQYGSAHFQFVHTYDKEDITGSLKLATPNQNDLVLIKNNENLGFAKANNIGIKFAEITGFEYIYLLNNDTVVESESLSKLSLSLFNSQYSAVVPQIRYYSPSNLIWCCGGTIKNFYELYNYKNQTVDKIPKKDFLDITFATGCALLFKRSDIIQLTEKFFFGEEDFELSIRLKKQGLKMACVLNALIYHKENTSINRSTGYLNKIYIHKLNRFIGIKTYAPSGWPLTVCYRCGKFFLLLLLVEKVGILKSIKYAAKLLHQSFTLNEVNKAMFFYLLKLDFTR